MCDNKDAEIQILLAQSSQWNSSLLQNIVMAMALGVLNGGLDQFIDELAMMVNWILHVWRQRSSEYYVLGDDSKGKRWPS